MQPLQVGQKSGAEWQKQCTSVLLSVLLVGSTAWLAGPVRADSVTDRRANDLEKRKQLLASTCALSSALAFLSWAHCCCQGPGQGLS